MRTLAVLIVAMSLTVFNGPVQAGGRLPQLVATRYGLMTPSKAHWLSNKIASYRAINDPQRPLPPTVVEAKAKFYASLPSGTHIYGTPGFVVMDGATSGEYLSGHARVVKESSGFVVYSREHKAIAHYSTRAQIFASSHLYERFEKPGQKLSPSEDKYTLIEIVP